MERFLQMAGWLRMENIVPFVMGLKPSDFLHNPYLAGGFFGFLLLLILMRCLRTAAFLAGLFLLWAGASAFIPRGVGDLQFDQLVPFALVGLGVGVLWIYFFFIKGD